MAGLRDTFDPVNVSKERDELGRTQDLIGTEVKQLAEDQPQAPQAAPQAPEPSVMEEEPRQEDDFSTTLDSMFSQTDSTDDFESTLDSMFAQPQGGPEDFGSTLDSMFTQEGVGVPTEKGVQFSGVEAIDEVLQSFDKGSMTKGKALEDPRVMNLIRTGLEFRFGDRGSLRKVAGAVASGISTNYTDDMSDEETYEMWQNWQRSFHGGQTSTLAAETIFSVGLDEEEKAFYGGQFLLFDKHPDIFDSETSYSEMFDGIYDYTKAALYDATTVMSFGVGRALSIGGSKAAAAGVRQAAKAAFKASLKSGATREVAEQAAKKVAKTTFIKAGAKEMAAYSAVDFVANVGGDIASQNLLIDVGAQDEYSATQTGIAALATIAIPAVLGTSAAYSAFARSDAAPSFLKSAVDVSEKFKGMTKETIDTQMKARIDWDLVNDQFGETIGNFTKNRGLYQKWSDALVDSKGMIGEGINLTDNEKVFMRGFMFGPTDGSSKGFVQVMEEAGLVAVQRDADDNITNFIGDAISWLPDEQVSGYVKAFTDTFEDFNIAPNDALGLRASKLSQIETAEELAAFWRVRQSEVGSRLWDSSEIKRRLSRTGKKVGPAGEGEATATDLIDAMLGEVGKEVPEKQRMAYVGSLWKSSLTATPATTGANLRGWAAYTGLNTVSDLIGGALNIGVYGMQKAIGADDAAKITMQTGKSSILGSMRRGTSFLSASSTLESAKGFLELNPKVSRALSREMGGDSGVAAGKETLELFGLNPKSKLNNGLESVRNFVQTVSGVKLQDELTKQLNFMTHLDQYTMKYYGVSYNKFMDDPKLGYIAMQSPKFHDTVVKDALDRTLRETGSLAWAGKEGNTYALQIARGVEGFSRNSAGGYIIPFGKFFNTATAMLGDYSGANLAIYTARKVSGAKSTGLASEELTTLASKAVVGWTGVILLSEDKLENIDKGLAANMVRQADGSIRDVSMDFPENVMHYLGQAMAHYRKDGRVPADLKTDIGDLILGNTSRSGATTFKLILDTLSGDVTPTELLEKSIDATIKTAAGFSRPLDPINSLIKLVEQDFDEPDRNISGDKWVDWSMTKKATRYTDQFFELLGAGPTEATPKASMGILTSGSSPIEPSLLVGSRRAGNISLSRKMINSVGKADWSTFKWGGDPDLKNWMNSRMENIFEAHAEIMLEDNPDFFDLPLLERETLVTDMISSSRAMLTDYMKVKGGPEMDYRQRLDKVNKVHLQEAMKLLDLEGDPLELLKDEGGLERLNTLLYIAEGTTERILGK